MTRLAFIVSHPIQYYAPLHQRLAQRDDIEIKLFFTWHDGRQAVRDSGFQREVAWDIPLTDGYDYELVPNVASDPGTHHFNGLRNPELVERVQSWRPGAVHLTGWAWASHLWAMRELNKAGIPVLFRGDSHLLDSGRRGPRWWLKRAMLRRAFSWPRACLYVGQANKAYYEAFGVLADHLYHCPHSIDVARFSEPAGQYECEAREWRHELAIADDQVVLLFAGKFEPKKRPVDLMRAVLACGEGAPMLIMVGNGILENEVQSLAAAHPKRFRVLPFQNQKRMPVVYRLGDLFVLPSAWGETWGLAINEALACGRPVLVSDRVGCAADVVGSASGKNAAHGAVFPFNDQSAQVMAIRRWCDLARRPGVRGAASAKALEFDLGRTEAALLACLRAVTA